MMDPQIVDALNHEQSELHSKLLRYAKNRIEAAERYWSQRHEPWNEAERLYRAFREPDQEDKETRSKSLTEGVQKIVVPYSFGQALSVVAFLMSTFTERKPMLPVEAVGDYENAAIIHEHLLEYQWDAMRPRGLLVLYQWFLDFLRYGVGITKNTWTIREFPDLVRTFAPDAMGGMSDEMEERDVVAYEGNEMLNILPFDFLPDPSRTMGEFQKGEFVFHRMQRSQTELKQKEAQGIYAGVQYVPDQQRDRGTNTGKSSRGEMSELGDLVGMAGGARENVDEYHKPIRTIHEGWCFLTPSELGLPTKSASQTPRLWVITVANRSRVIRAEPANLPGRRFPFAVMESHYDVHSPSNPGMIEVTSGLNYHMSWLFNSRMANVRKTLNNEWVVDPSLIEMADLENPNPGGYVRMNKDAYGAFKPGEAIFPVPVNDVTAGYYNDSRGVAEIMDDITGATRNLRGSPNLGRRSATESQITATSGTGRMRLLALLASAQGVTDIAEQQIANTQRFFGETLQLRVQDPYTAVLGMDFLTVTPDLLQGFFRIPILETGIPTDKQFHANVLREIFGMGMQNPQGAAAMGVNLLEIFIELMRTLGKRNLKAFITPPMPMQPGMPGGVTTMPDEQVQQQVQQGNLVPSDGYPMPQQNGVPGTGMNGTQRA